MSSAEATVDETVLATTTVRDNDVTREATVLAAIAVMQVTWLGGIVYGAIWLLT